MPRLRHDVPATIADLDQRLYALDCEVQSLAPPISLPPGAPRPRRPASRARAGTALRVVSPGPATAPESFARTTLEEAEHEAIAVVAAATRRVTEIGARTRTLLEHAAEAPASAMAGQMVRSGDDPQRRTYEGDVTVEAGRFFDIEQLSAFQAALEAVPGVVDVYVDTFEHRLANFRLHVTEPTPLVAELQRRASQPLYVVHAGPGELRLEILEDE